MSTDTFAHEMPRLKKQYREQIRPAMQEEFDYKNPMLIPGLEKIVVNMGVGDAAHDSKVMDGAVRDITAITGQKPQVTKARKSIAQFKLREGQPIGCHVTLRGDRMWEFADRLLTLALPRIRDFRGLNSNQFDGKGNYTFGLSEQVMFLEIDQDKIDRVRGMDITFVTTAQTNEEGKALLKHLGFPFKAKDDSKKAKTKRGPAYYAKKKKKLGSDGQDSSEGQGGPQAQVRCPCLHPLPALRSSALGVPQVRPVPNLPARDGPRRSAPGCHQVLLVTSARPSRMQIHGPYQAPAGW